MEGQKVDARESFTNDKNLFTQFMHMKQIFIPFFLCTDQSGAEQREMDEGHSQ
jgi:hypothetical protein